MLDHYSERFARLRTDASSSRWPAATTHRAPHKPLLLLSVADLIAEGTFTENLVPISDDLADVFNLYWSKVMPPETRGNLALPFFHLQSDGFWRLLPRGEPEERLLGAIRQIRSIIQLREVALGATLDQELFELLAVGKSRETLRATLIESYFAPEVRPALIEQGIVNVQAYEYSKQLLKQAGGERVADTVDTEAAYRPAARSQGFRRAILTAYERRCALCGIRMLTPEGRTAVDAAHIKPWSTSRDDSPTNGMALCRLCHWCFDEGLVCVSIKYTVLASPQLTAGPNLPGHVTTLHGRYLLCPADETLWPSPGALKWHQQHIYRRR